MEDLQKNSHQHISAGGFVTLIIVASERKVQMIYFDNSATTLPDESVLTSFIEVNRRFFANPASLHLAGKEAESLLERSRDQIISILACTGRGTLFSLLAEQRRII